MQKEKRLNPQLRFPEFNTNWKISKIGDLGYFYYGKSAPKWSVTEDAETPCVRYGELYSKFKEVIKEVYSYTNINPKDLKFSKGGEVLVPRVGENPLEFAKCSHLTLPNVAIGEMISVFNTDEDSLFITYCFNATCKKSFAKVVEGANVSNLYFRYLEHIEVSFPGIDEQQKIASFLTTIDSRLQSLEKKKTLLEQYKKGVIQQIFKQEIRFKDENGNTFPKWEKRRFSDVFFEHKLKSTGNEEVHSVSVHKGVINQIEHLGRSFSAKNTDHYSRVLPNDIIYTKSPTGDFPLGIIKQSHINEDVIVSPLYGVFTPETKELGYMLHVYFESPINTSNYLSSIIQKGAKNTINITNNTFLSKRMLLPVSKEEQTKIANFLSAIDKKIALVNEQIEKTKTYKKGLLQQMFV